MIEWTNATESSKIAAVVWNLWRANQPEVPAISWLGVPPGLPNLTPFAAHFMGVLGPLQGGPSIQKLRETTELHGVSGL